jgi:hypothetical protein
MGKMTFLMMALCCGGASFAQTQDLYIQSDRLPPASAEKVVPLHPFFSEPTTGNEVFESVVEQQHQIEKLEERVTRLEAEVGALKHVSPDAINDGTNRK